MKIYHLSFSISHLRDKSSTVSRSEAGFTPVSAKKETK